MAKTTEKKWMGAKPDSCDLCGHVLKSGQFIDGKTVHGPWAIMCPTCHLMYGVGLGTGLGQRYDGFTLKKLEG
jgi:hypothetical protein